MKVAIRWIGSHLAGLSWEALRSFLRTLLVFALAGIVLPSVSYWFLRDYYWVYGGIAVAVALIESVTHAYIRVQRPSSHGGR